MLQLNGQQLTLQQIADIAEGREQVVLAGEARARVEQACQVVHDIVTEGRTVYGVNTGFGKLSDVSIDKADLLQLQLNLVRSHSVGLGEPLSEAEARALVIDTLAAMLEKDVTPVIPEKGSVGASGDLAPLAHLALAAIGEGEVFYQGERLPSGVALERAEIRPLELQVKEGLALLNGTQAMGAVGALALARARRLSRLATV